jgi:hypothetical protein
MAMASRCWKLLDAAIVETFLDFLVGTIRRRKIMRVFDVPQINLKRGRAMAMGKSKEISSVVVLIAALTLALSLWLLWMFFGAEIVNSHFVHRAQQTASAPSTDALRAPLCLRRLNFDPPCRFNIDPGRIVAF